MGTRGEWARDFLKALGNGAPDGRTINLVAAWTRQEFGSHEPQAASYNPLATTLPYGKSTRYNSHNVQNFENRHDGISASILTLMGNHKGYSEIVAGLQTNDPERALAGMKQSPWGTNFATVEQVWRSKDVTGELLPGEDPARWKDSPAKAPADWTGGGGGGWGGGSSGGQAGGGGSSGDWGGSAAAPSITSNDVRAALIAMGGAGLMAVGAILIIIEIARGSSGGLVGAIIK